MGKTSTPSEPLDLAPWEAQLRKGALGLAVLASLWDERRYGLDILRRLGGEAGLTTAEGTIYPLLSRLQREGLVSSQWVASDAGHPRKYYALTDQGRERTRDMAGAWRTFSGGVDALISPIVITDGAHAA